MILTLEQAREVALLAAQLAGFARSEGKYPLGGGLDAIADAARGARDVSELPALNAELREAYSALYAPKGEGLGDLFRWDSDVNLRMRLNEELERLRSRLDVLLSDPT
jgi:hypothetical protein